MTINIGWRADEIPAKYIGRNYRMHEDVEPVIRHEGLTYDLIYARLSPNHARIWTNYRLRGYNPK